MLFALWYFTVAITVFYWLTINTDEPIEDCIIRSLFWSIWLFSVCIILLSENHGRD